jgi:hypothetical protein
MHATHPTHLIHLDLILIFVKEYKFSRSHYADFTCDFLLRFEYSQNPVLEHPEPVFFPKFERPSFTPILTEGGNAKDSKLNGSKHFDFNVLLISSWI